MGWWWRASVCSAVVLVSGAGLCQSPPALNLVQPKGAGRVVYQGDPAWKLQRFVLLDDGTRPFLQLANAQTKVTVSYAIFGNDTGRRDSDACRKAVVGPIVQGLGIVGKLKGDRSETFTTADGRMLATRSFVVESSHDGRIEQKNVYGFFGDQTTCFEVHVSKMQFQDSDDRLLHAELDRFHFEPEYGPTTTDYFQMGQIFFQARKEPDAAAPYFRAGLDSLEGVPVDDEVTMARRVLTDELVMAYGMMGEMKKSRELAKEGIARDPEYPLNYYNLACADAEQGHAADARVHLEQAFARKANVLPGETMPDPSRDMSIQKLKKDAAFWGFVQGLSTPMGLKRR